jgi:diguanylate cyclase (GGDEF)-like protein
MKAVEAESPVQQVSKSFLDQFNAMQRSGALDDLALLRNENRVLDNLLNDAAKLYAIGSVEEVMDFVIDRVLQEFIPTYLLVIMESPRGGLRQYCYANMKPSEEQLTQGTYESLKSRFISAKYPTDFIKIDLPARAIVELSRFDPDIVIPMCGIEGTFGLGILGRKVVGEAYTPVERMYIDKFMRFISIAIQNNLNRESAITDAKTGLYNHAYFKQRLEQEIAHVKRHDAKAGLIMLDIDHFKNFNDTWGHLAGDEVLNHLALALKRTVRVEDVASRFGGEEFCVLAIECDAVKLWDMSERIRRAIEETAVPYKAETLSVTASLGCCLIDPNLSAGVQDYVDMADRALYQSKGKGRNRSTLYKPGLLDRARAIRELLD